MHAGAHRGVSGPGAWPGWREMRGRKEMGKMTSEELHHQGPELYPEGFGEQ